MNRTHPAFWGFGLAGLVGGAILSAIGIIGADDVASLAGSYGLLLIGSAAYLLAGLKLRERLVSRTPAAATSTSAVSAQS